MSKIICLVLAYFDFESIKTTCKGLVPYSDRLDLYIVENPSEATESHIKPFVLDLVRSGHVSHYFLFDKNITNNAFEMVLQSEYINLQDSEYILLSDGDLELSSQDWLDEELSIMRACPEVFACGINLDLSNLPLENFPTAHRWLAELLQRHRLYDEAATAMHLTLFRSRELQGFLSYLGCRPRLRFTDTELFNYCYGVLHMRWARTRKSLARHLAWDRYHDLVHPYTRRKLSKSFQDTWRHYRYCGFQVYTEESVKRHVPWRRIGSGYIFEFQRRLWAYGRNGKQVLGRLGQLC